ncbi:hypothetical protein AGDE_14578 [Angomonas deanei]|nr:hypothetical protein AGDE_14578 [Angomonas deanei]|eukprot:EPY20605.1 hypothetical protein AGDE_14578 [Angomonas deanei]
MKDICDRQKNELEEALKDIARMRKEHSDYERETTATIEKIRWELIKERQMHETLKKTFSDHEKETAVTTEKIREELTKVGEMNIKWFLHTHGPLKPLDEYYRAYREGLISHEVLRAYCSRFGLKWQYDFTKEALLTVTAVGTCVEYFTTVLPLLPAVTSVQFPLCEECTPREDRRTMIGGGSVGEFLTTVVDLLPEPKYIKGFYTYLHEYYLAYKAGDISHEVLKVFCYGWTDPTLPVGTPEELSAGVPLGDYCETVLPLLPSVTGIRVGEEVDTVDWCATLPGRITRVNVWHCGAVKDFTPLLAVKGLRQVIYNRYTNPSLKTILDQLKNKGVRAGELW